MSITRLHIVLAIALAAAAGGIWQARQLRSHQTRLDQTRNQNTTLNQELVNAQLQLATLAHARREAESQRDRALARAEQARRTATAPPPAPEPEPDWNQPPPVWPSWDTASPYVWIRKEDLAKLHAPVFTSQGTIQPQAASILALNENDVRNLNSLLPQILEDYKVHEITHAEYLDQPPAGPPKDGRSVTIRINPFPEEARRLREEFEAALQESFGDQRARLLIQSGSHWLQQHLSHTEPKTYSLIQHPNGSYNLSIHRPGGNSSMAGNIKLSDHIPEHLLPAFEELMQPPPP